MIASSGDISRETIPPVQKDVKKLMLASLRPAKRLAATILGYSENDQEDGEVNVEIPRSSIWMMKRRFGISPGSSTSVPGPGPIAARRQYFALRGSARSRPGCRGRSGINKCRQCPQGARPWPDLHRGRRHVASRFASARG
jgi:hypothetical protein